MAKIACASHILLKTKQEAQKVQLRLDKGENFAQLAKQFSSCNSAKSGGDLGEFRKGQMVAQFDRAVFAKGSEDKAYLGPIKSKFGFHLIQVLYKS